MTNTLWEDWRSPDATAVITGTVMLRSWAQRDAGGAGAGKTLATIGYPIQVVDSQFSVTDVPAGEYEVDLDLRVDDADADVELTSNDQTARIVIPDDGGSHRLRDLLDLGVVAVSPSARLEQIVSDWLTANPVGNSTVAAMVTAAGPTKTALDASYATTAQGAKADSAVQPAALTSGLAGKANAAHTHATGDIPALTEYIQDAVNDLIQAGANVTKSYDDAANTLTISATGGGGGGTDAEVVRDTIAAALVASTGINIAVDDAADTITISVAGIPASAITTGTVNTARLGSGTASATTYLRGDGTWSALPAGNAVTPEQYGAVGDGTTNDTTAMQSWLTAVVTGKLRGVLASGKTYRITAALTVATQGAAGFSVDGQGATILQATNGASILAFTRENVSNFDFDNITADWVNPQTSAMGTAAVTFDDGANTALGFGLFAARFRNWRFSGKAYRGFQTLENSHVNAVWNTEFRDIRGDYGMGGSLIRLHSSIGQANVRFAGCYQHRGTSTEPVIDAQLLTGFSITDFESNNEVSTAKNSILLSYCFGGSITFRSERGSLADGEAVVSLVGCAGVTVPSYQVSAIESYGSTNNAIFDISGATSSFAVLGGVIDYYSPYPAPPATLSVVKADSTSTISALETVRGGSAYPVNPASKAPKVATSKIDATGTASATTYLRGDGAWATPAGGASKRALESTMVRSDRRVYGDLSSYTADSTAPSGTAFAYGSNTAKFRVNCPLVDLGGLWMPQYNGSTAAVGTSPAGFTVEVIHSGTSFAFQLGYGTYHQVYVDGQPVTAAPQANNSGGYTYVKLTFAAARARRITIECNTGTSFSGAYSNAANTFYAPPARKFRAAIIGDSWVQQGMCEHLAMVTGWDVYNLGQGSTGYVADGGGTSGSLGHTPFGSSQRMTALAALPALDLIIPFGSVNDTPHTASAVATAAQAHWAAIRSARATTPIIVVGHEPSRGGTAADDINAALKTAAQSHAAVAAFIDWRAASTLTGTGNVGSKAGDGINDFYMGTDNLHPTAEGFLYLARELADLLGPIQV